MMDSTPRWIRDVTRLLPIRSQMVLAGNIRDTFLTPHASSTTLAPLLRCLWMRLTPLDYRFLLVYDPIDGLRPYPNEPAAVEQATQLFDLKLADGVMAMSLENLIGVMKKVAAQREARCALVIDFASRLTRPPDHLDANEHRFFVAAERMSLAANPIVPRGADIATGWQGAFQSRAVARQSRAGSAAVAGLRFDARGVLTIGLPDFETRVAAAPLLGSLFSGL